MQIFCSGEKMSVKYTPDEVAEKWARRMKAATEDIRRGVEKVTEAPSLKAVQKKDKMKAKLMEAIDKGVWEYWLKKYGLEDWKRDMASKALPRIPSGVDAATPDFRDFMNQLLGHINSILPEIQKMPDMTLDDSIARVEKFIRRMSEFKRK
jgi:hypothetical protein